MTNKVLELYLDKYVIIYLNDILIYLETLDEYKE